MRAAIVVVLAVSTGFVTLNGQQSPAAAGHTCPLVAPPSQTDRPPDTGPSALSETQITQLLAGEGMGQATVAEMTGYPGPKHVLELADSLQLTDAQRRTVQAAFDEMHAETRRLGALLVASERDLYRAFAANGVTSEAIDALTMRIGHLQAMLRARHLKAHADTRAVLASPQVEAYRRLRGHSGH